MKEIRIRIDNVVFMWSVFKPVTNVFFRWLHRQKQLDASAGSQDSNADLKITICRSNWYKYNGKIWK